MSSLFQNLAAIPARNAAPNIVISKLSGLCMTTPVRSDAVCRTKLLLTTPLLKQKTGKLEGQIMACCSGLQMKIQMVTIHDSLADHMHACICMILTHVHACICMHVHGCVSGASNQAKPRCTADCYWHNFLYTN